MENPEVRKALQSSRYNEIVVVNVEEEEEEEEATAEVEENPSSSSSPPKKTKKKTKEILLIPCLDEENGGIIWNQLNNNNNNDGNDDDIGIVRHLRTKQWFFPMLNDFRRNELYKIAIQNASKEVVRRRRSSSSSSRHLLPIRVLEIGAGTGLLSMMAVKFIEQEWRKEQQPQQQQKDDNNNNNNNNNIVHVTALEMSSAMCRLARRTISDNGLPDKITVLEKHSIDYDTTTAASTTTKGGDDNDEHSNNNDNNNSNQFSLCVSELLESSLLSEGILPALRDAWDRHLLSNHDIDDNDDDDAVMIPQKARVFCQLMEGSFVKSFWGPHTTTTTTTTTSTKLNNNNDDNNNNNNTASSSSYSETAAAGADDDDDDDHNDDIRLSLSANHNDVMLDGGCRGGLILPIHAEYWVDHHHQTSSSTSTTKMMMMSERTTSSTKTSSNTPPPTTSAGARKSCFHTHDDKTLLKPLSDPVEVMDFDFSSRGKLPGSEGRQKQTTIIPHTSGKIHAILFWWELDLWNNNNNNNNHNNKESSRSTSSNNKNNNTYTYSTQAGKEPWQDHWHQALFIFTNTNNTNTTTTTTTNNNNNNNNNSNHHHSNTATTTMPAKNGDPKAKIQQDDVHRVLAGEACQLLTSHNDNALWFSIMTEPSYSDDDDELSPLPRNEEENQETNDQKPPPIKRQKQQQQQQRQGDRSSSREEIGDKLSVKERTPPSDQMETPSKGLISPQRAWQLNEKKRKQFLKRGIKAALEFKGYDAVVLDLSDFSFCAIVAALQGANRVTSLESSSGLVPTISARVAQLANNLPRRRRRRKSVVADYNNKAGLAVGQKEEGEGEEGEEENALFQVIQCHAENLSLKLLNGRGRGGKDGGGGGDDDENKLDRVEVVLAEPYYEMLEGWHLQEALNYFYLTTALRKRGILSETAVSVPSLAIIKGCAIQSFQLKSAYRGCGGTGSSSSCGEDDKATIGGFDHSKANYYGDRFASHDLSIPTWQYDYAKLTETFEIARLCYDSGSTHKKTSIRVPFQRAGTCHGILIWVDYANTAMKGDQQAHAKQSAAVDHSTLGWSYNQLIRMLPIPHTIDDDDFREYELCCHFRIGSQDQDLESYKIDLQVDKHTPEASMTVPHPQRTFETRKL